KSCATNWPATPPTSVEALMTEAARDPEETIDARLAEALEGYCRESGQGQDPDPQACLERHADVAGELSGCLEGLAAMEELRRALQGPPPAPHSVGDFELLGEIGRGGMGVVYRARQVRLNRTVALKLIRA